MCEYNTTGSDCSNSSWDGEFLTFDDWGAGSGNIYVAKTVCTYVCTIKQVRIVSIQFGIWVYHAKI